MNAYALISTDLLGVQNIEGLYVYKTDAVEAKMLLEGNYEGDLLYHVETMYINTGDK